MLQYSEAWLDEKPYKEIYDSRIHEKVSPSSAHSIVQLQIGRLLGAWGDTRGAVFGTEWRCRLGKRTTLVPDVSLFLEGRFDEPAENKRELPRFAPFAPDLVVEIRSPDDREANVRRKTELYLAHGAKVVLNVDPQERTVRVSTQEEDAVLREGDVFTYREFPGLEIPVGAIFAPLDRRR